MPVSQEFRDFVLDQLVKVPHDQRRMFGGVGLFSDGLMFGIITRSDALYLKTDETTAPDYEALGAKPFTYTRNGATRTMGGYFEVPADLLDDADELSEWARRAIEVARRIAATKHKPVPRPRRRRGSSKDQRTR